MGRDKTDKNRFVYESLQDGESIVAYLQALAEGFARGSLSLTSNGNELVLDPCGLLRFCIEAKRGSHRSRLSLKVSWREAHPSADQPVPDLEIKPRTGRNT